MLLLELDVPPAALDVIAVGREGAAEDVTFKGRAEEDCAMFEDNGDNGAALLTFRVYQ